MDTVKRALEVLKPVYIALTQFQTRIENPLRSRI